MSEVSVRARFAGFLQFHTLRSSKTNWRKVPYLRGVETDISSGSLTCSDRLLPRWTKVQDQCNSKEETISTTYSEGLVFTLFRVEGPAFDIEGSISGNCVNEMSRFENGY